MCAVTDTVANEIYSQDNCSLFVCLCVCVCVCVCVFSSHPEKASYLLYNLIDSMSEKEVQAQEDKLQKYFKQLQALVCTLTHTHTHTHTLMR